MVTAVALMAVGAGLYWARRPTSTALEAGVSRSLAEDRAAKISNLRYLVSFKIPANRDQGITGRIEATFALSDASRPIALDFAQPADHVVAVQTNGAAVETKTENGHIVIPAAALTSGPNTIQIDFLAGNQSLNRHDDFLYTLFVPARASLAMPCFDQPDLKARWVLALDVPAGWTAVANGAETGRIGAPDHTGFVFAETQPLPTYLFGFAAGTFSIETAERNGRTFRMFHRETDAKKVARNREAIFDLHAGALAWLERYTGIPYPFGKFDFVLIPSFQFGGMEHAGAIDYNASALLLDESATQTQLLNRANTISHETAHMWFGDLVTMRWFNDVWMKEVFANFMAAKIVNPSFPTVNHDLRFFLQNYPVAYDVDRTDGANPIRQDLTNLDEAGSLYGAIIYQKAPIVMRQLELLVGADAFRDGLRVYLKRHAFGNATWPDLLDALQPSTTDDLKAWSHAWVDEPGRPRIRTVIDGARVTFVEEDPRGRALTWPQHIKVTAGSASGVTTTDLRLPKQNALESSAGRAPQWILPAGGGLGYGEFDLDPATLEFLTTSLSQIAEPLERGSALVALWDCMLEGKVPAARVLDQLLSALPREADELNVSQMLDDVRAAFWRFTTPERRRAIAPRLETTLKDGIARAPSTSLKAAWFAAFRSTVTTVDGVAWLEKIWRRDVKIDGLPLSESDEADIACDLAVRDAENTTAMLEAQLARFTNPDRKARFAFIMPAISRDAEVRDRFFDSLKDVKNRQREAWVLDAMRYLHHPLRAPLSEKHVRAALELLREIQRTGDIFFPKRWTDATLGGYQTAGTATIVRAFIDALPADYPPRLRWVLLSSVDPLFRAAKLP
jgi:aminopeptidase N